MDTCQNSIVVNNLSKDFEYYVKEEGLKGSFRNIFKRETIIKNAVKEISFSVPEGEMIGFIGPNGAGKTTTLKMLAGIIYPTSGEVYVNGYIPSQRKTAFKKNITIVMGQKSQLWWDLPAIESFNFNASLYEVDNSEYKKRLHKMCDMLDVNDFLNIQVRRLSLGERMKMELIAALIHNPKIIFLDEPTIGLDMKSQRIIRNFFKEYNKLYNATISITSHYLEDITDLCERTVVISEGNIVYDGELASVNDLFQSSKMVTLKFENEADTRLLENFGKIRSISKVDAVLEVEKHKVNTVMKELFDKFKIIDFNIEDLPLEEGIEKLYTSKI